MLKMIAFTVVVVLILQFKVGEQTLEFRAHQWIQDSVFVDYVQTSIDGGVKATKAGYQKVHKSVNTVFNRMSRKNRGKDERSLAIELKRSKQSGYGEKENGEDSYLPHSRNKNLNP
ncbi:MAG: hypothetical protein IPM57_03410 [Oligoflexia bacterium]|nr:hypothetical protein [Oligoflexia bacterium]